MNKKWAKVLWTVVVAIFIKKTKGSRRAGIVGLASEMCAS